LGSGLLKEKKNVPGKRTNAAIYETIHPQKWVMETPHSGRNTLVPCTEYELLRNALVAKKNVQLREESRHTTQSPSTMVQSEEYLINTGV
jgi:hypothetical protein